MTTTKHEDYMRVEKDARVLCMRSEDGIVDGCSDPHGTIRIKSVSNNKHNKKGTVELEKWLW